MATIDVRKNKQGEITGYRLRVCVGRDEQYKQVWRTRTVPRPENLTPAKEKKEVQRIADEWEVAQKAEYERTHAKESRDRITFAGFVQNHWWVDHVEDGEHTPNTVSFFRYMSNDIVAYFGGKRLNQIDVESVKRFVKYLRTEARTKKGEPYSQSTIQHHYKTLVNILDYGVRTGYLLSNPCNNLTTKEKPHKERGKTIDFLEPDQAREFMRCLEKEAKETKSLFWMVFANVLITCGLRRGECLGLTWADIDPDKLTLDICRNITADKAAPEKFRIGNTKSGESRTVPLSPRVYGLLMSLKHEQEERLHVKLLPSSYIFCRTEDPGKPLYPTSPTRWLKNFVQKYDLPNISPHDLRHTAASLALEGGANLKEVQQLLGHADPGTTMQFYTGISETAQKRTAEKIENLIG